MKFLVEIQDHSKDKVRSKNSKVMRKSLKYKDCRYKSNKHSYLKIKRASGTRTPMLEGIIKTKIINKDKAIRNMMMIMIVRMILIAMILK